ncbi:chitin synthase [Elysia marginata]|uniref:chitin synthase n=1 Tax=Elysia marginata TaxID=1093978 RepID=A0AAV4FC33_9GAST|nr:chitin synthase [Elysia marginata]
MTAGEDRWLCTLLLQQGYRVEYCAAADALTYCPEGFNEFYNQRRRWTPSTMANILDLLSSWRLLIQTNENFSALYVLYQLLLFASSLLTPATIFLLIVGAFNTAFQQVDLVEALFINLSPVLLFLILCFLTKSKVQLAVASVLSIGYALLMMVVVVGLVLEMKKDGICAPTTIFTICITSMFIIAALMHPLEFSNLFHGLLYLLAVPSTSMLLMIYSIANLNVVAWGTREVTDTQLQADQEAKASRKMSQGKLQSFMKLFHLGGDGQSTEDSDFGFSCGNLFRCLWCPREKPDPALANTTAILEKLETMEKTLAALTGEASGGSEVAIEPADVTASVDSGQGSCSVTGQDTADKEPSTEGATIQAVDTASQESGMDNVKQNPLFRETVSPYEAQYSPFWIQDPTLGRGNIRYLGTEEVRFWREVIDRYLHPVVMDKQKQQQLEDDLRLLRNKFSLMFLLLNALFVVVVFALQYTNAEEEGDGLAIPLPCKNDEGKNLTLEPISLIFMAIFGIALLVQFLAMFFHRMGTFLHIISSTEVNCMKLNQSELAAMDISDKLELVQQMTTFQDDDEDTRSDITSTSRDTAADESSSNTDESPKLGRRRTVIRLTKKRSRQEQKGSNLGNKFMERYLRLAKELRSERVSVRSRHRRNSSKKKRKSRRAIEAIEKSDKSSVLLKAHKWQNIHRARTGKSSVSIDAMNDDPWVTLVKGVFSQSRTSLNTITEDDYRSPQRRKNTWSSGDLSAVPNSTRGGGAHLSWVERERNKLGNPTAYPGNSLGLSNRRTSFGGRRSGSFNVLSSVKEVTSTPGSSVTEIHSTAGGNRSHTDADNRSPTLGVGGKNKARRVVINSDVISSTISADSDEVVVDNPVYISHGDASASIFDYDVIEMSALEKPKVSEISVEISEIGIEPAASRHNSEGSVALDSVFESVDVIVHKNSTSTDNVMGDKGSEKKDSDKDDEDLASGGSTDTFNATLTYSPALVAASVAQTPPPICFNPQQMDAAASKCYSDQGLVLHMPLDPRNLDNIKDAALKNQMTHSPEAVCKNTAAYDAAIHCSLQLSLSCTMPGYENYLPSESNLKTAQNVMCSNQHLIDHLCTVNQTHDMVDCGHRKYGEMSVADAMDPYKSTCLAYIHAEECLEEEVSECGQATVEIHKQLNQLNAPVICQGGSSIGK